VENLKIVHTTEEKNQEKKQKEKSKNRRVSERFKIGDRKYSRQSETEEFPKHKRNVDLKRSPSYKKPCFNDDNQTSNFLRQKNARLTRNTENENKGGSKSYTNHIHHKSSSDIENPRNLSKYPYDSKFMEMTKKRHRKDMKSGDNFQANNFKFLNVNWLNQNQNEVAPHFYANQMVSGGMENPNHTIYQNMDVSQLNNYTNQADISTLMNQVQLNNNQSLLVYDKQTNSIIPLTGNLGNQGNNLVMQNPNFPSMSAINQSEIDTTPSKSILNTAKKENNVMSRPEPMSSIPFYLQDAQMKLDFKNKIEGKTPEANRGNYIMDKDIPALKFDMEESTSNLLTNQSKNIYSNNKEMMSDSSISMAVKSSLVKETPQDSLNNRIETGIRALEISRLKASDYDLNNRESESINMDQLLSKKKLELVKDTIVEESDNVDSLLQSKEQDQLDNVQKIEDKAKDSLIWIETDHNKSSKNIEMKKKIMEKRLNQRNKQKSKSFAKSRSKSQKFDDNTSDSEVADKMDDSIN